MKTTKTPHQAHLLFCTNTREDKSKPSCGNTPVTVELAEALKKRFKELHLPVRVSQTGCLGPCAMGPNVMCYPQGVWFQAVGENDAALIEAETRRMLEDTDSVRTQDS